MSECLECGSSIDTGTNLMEGEILACSACGIELEVTGTNPISLELAPEIEEDWGE